jgi:integrase
MPRIKLTERVIPRLKGRPASSNSKEPVAYWDKDMPGFGVVVSTKTGLKSYVAQRDLPNGRSRRVTIGVVGTEIPTLEDAREQARDIIHDMRHGVDPRAARRGEVATLAQTMELYIGSHPNLAAKSVAGYRDTLKHHLEDWRELRLTEITAAMVEARHKKIGEQKGKAIANAVMRALRALYNDAIDTHPEITANPVRLRRKWYKIVRRERHVSADELPRFVKAVKDLENPIARDYLLLLLYTGLRRLEAASLTWMDIDFAAKVIRLPANRTKPGRRLDLPMSDIVDKMLSARRRLGDAEYVFPAHGTRGHIAEPKYPLGIVAEATGISISAHDLRRTFAKAAVAAGIHTIVLKALLNHSTGENDEVTVGYVNLNENDLREPAQRVANQIKKWSRIRQM